jgi:hypothetical protein
MVRVQSGQGDLYVVWLVQGVFVVLLMARPEVDVVNAA